MFFSAAVAIARRAIVAHGRSKAIGHASTWCASFKAFSRGCVVGG